MLYWSWAKNRKLENGSPPTRRFPKTHESAANKSGSTGSKSRDKLASQD